MPKTTHIEKQRNTYSCNQSLVQQHTKMSLSDYYTHEMELGCNFLEHIYPGDEWKPHYIHHSQSKTYWSWWEIEFKVFEISVIDYMAKHGIPMNEDNYKDQMEEIVTNGFVETSFQDNYLKELTTNPIY